MIQSISLNATLITFSSIYPSIYQQLIILVFLFIWQIQYKQLYYIFNLQYRALSDRPTQIILPLLFIIIYQIFMKKQAADKREKFREEIRRKQIDQIFKKARKQLHQSLNAEGFMNESSNKKQYIADLINDFIRKCFLNYHSKDYLSMMKDINVIKRQVDINPILISVSLNQILKQKGNNLMDFMKKDVSKSSLEKLYLEVNQSTTSTNKIQQQFSYQIYIEIIDQLMSISANIQYNKFCQQSAIIILKPLWNVLQGNWYIVDKQHPYLAHKCTAILNNICISLTKLLQGPCQQVIRNHLKKMGLHQKLYKIINLSYNFNFETHKNLLTLIYYFNITNLEEIKNQYDLTGGVIITTSEDQFKIKQTQYCINFIVKQVQPLYELAIQTLIQIFQQNPYYIEKIQKDFFLQILELVVAQNRKINVIALDLLRIIVFSSMPACDQLVERKAILDYLYARLIIEKQIPRNQQFTKQCIGHCTVILCDLLLTRDNNIKKIMYKHHIWELIYQNLYEGSELFQTVVTFKYFFDCFGRRQRNSILPLFLQAVSHLHLQNQLVPEIRQLRQTLLNIFYFSMQNNCEEAHEQIVHQFQKNGLLKYIQEYEAKFEAYQQPN